MAWTTMEVVMSEELKERLHAAAKSQQKEIGVFVQEALFTYVEDIEDGVMSEMALTENGLIYVGNGTETEIALDHRLLKAS